MIISIIEVYKIKYIAISNITETFLTTNIDKLVVINIIGKILDILIKANLTTYKFYITTKKDRKKLYILNFLKLYIDVCRVLYSFREY